MRKRFIILLLVLTIPIIFAGYKNNSGGITGSTVTGEFTSQTAAFTIILSGYPSLSLIKPENKTYLTDKNLNLTFAVGGASVIWYNLDNGANVTITGNIEFDTTSGQHTLFLFANNTGGNETSRNVIFTVNTTKFIVIYNNYKNNGSSTDFNSSSFEDIQNLSGVVLERSNHGRVSFSTALNLTNDSDPSDNILDLDSYTNISQNSIEINTTALSNFNKSATLYLYNLTFTNPRVLRDGSVCPSTICTEISYSGAGGTFIFNVTQFTTYSAEETPTETAPGEQPPGGGGGGIQKGFTIDKSQISVSLIPGGVKTEEIVITNNGGSVMNFKIENSIPDFVVLNESSFSFQPGKSKLISIDFIARENTVPDLYLGKLVIKAGGQQKEVLMSIEVESQGSLLDLRAQILSDYNKIMPGGEILSEMRLFNLGGNARKDILVEYIIRDYEGNEIAKETESLAIETQTSFVKRINIPKDAKIGNYVLYVRAVYEGKVASSSDNFEIVSSKTTTGEKIYIALIIILFTIISSIVYTLIRRKASRERERRIGLEEIIKR